MKTFLSCAAMLAMVLLAWNADGATPTKKKAPVKKGATSAAKGKKKSSASSAASKNSKKKAPAKKSATTWRNRQLAPSTDRYREIQSALASKGYLKPEEATGSWNSTSSEALKKFQSEQNLDASGKINSLSLIALGLGPKRESPAIPPPPPQQNH
jgi:peptidoglycan hydrolase-like protein with peptidoglycan-binding domain